MIILFLLGSSSPWMIEVKSNIYTFIKDMVFYKATSRKATFWSRGKFQAPHRSFCFYCFPWYLIFFWLKQHSSLVMVTRRCFPVIWFANETGVMVIITVTLVLFRECNFSIFLAHWICICFLLPQLLNILH